MYLGSRISCQEPAVKTFYRLILIMDMNTYSVLLSRSLDNEDNDPIEGTETQHLQYCREQLIH